MIFPFNFHKGKNRFLPSGLLVLLCLFFISTTEAQEKTLAYFIGAGTKNSPLLKDYQQQQMSNLIDSLRIMAGYKPQVNGVSTNYYAPTVKGWGFDNAITNGVNFSQLISASQMLVSKENLRNQFDAIQLLNQSLSIAGKISEQDLSKSITAQYITAFGNWEQYRFNNEMLSLLKKEESILRNMTEKGIYRQTDYLSFLVTEQQQELQISQLKLQYQNEFATLNYLCGIKDTSAVSLSEPDIRVMLVPDIENTVFYQQFLVDSLKLQNSNALIEYNYKPKLSIYADGGYLSSFVEKSYKNFGVGAGINIVVPIYDGKQKKMQHDKINIAEQTRQGYRDFFKTQYQQQIAQLSQQLISTQQLISQTDKQIRYTETLMEANRKLLETGDVRMADYILAIGNYLTAKNLVTQLTVNKMQLINQINYWNKN